MAETLKVGEMPEKLRNEVIDILAAWERKRIVAAGARIRAAARVGRERKFVQDENGRGGEVAMQIEPTSYHYWGQKLGYKCWEDKQFCREYQRDNEYARVRSRNENLTVGYRGSAECGVRSAESGILAVAGGNTRFRKSYG